MEPFKSHTGKVYVLDRSDVDTDQIIPKQFLKRVERSGFGQYLFFDWVNDGEIELREGASILIAGANFGCGSSREHAPWALEDFGFKVIIAPSFADIFYTNCTKIGLLAVALDPRQIEQIKGEDQLLVDLDDKVIRAGDSEVPFEIEDRIRHHLLEGIDDIALTYSHGDEIDQYEEARKVLI